MRYFMDAEFNGFGGELLSIALVPEDGALPPFYEAIRCDKPTAWVQEHVQPVLEKRPLDRDQVSDRFFKYLHNDEHPVIVADWPEDIANAARLLILGPGRMQPIRRIHFELIDAAVIGPYVPSTKPHNARCDAEALRATVLAHEERLRWASSGPCHPSSY
jgi:hypothetical protein